MKLLLILLCVSLYSCMPNTNGKEPQVDAAINSINKNTNRVIDKLQKTKVKIYFDDDSVIVHK